MGLTEKLEFMSSLEKTSWWGQRGGWFEVKELSIMCRSEIRMLFAVELLRVIRSFQLPASELLTSSSSNFIDWSASKLGGLRRLGISELRQQTGGGGWTWRKIWCDSSRSCGGLFLLLMLLRLLMWLKKASLRLELACDLPGPVLEERMSGGEAGPEEWLESSFTSNQPPRQPHQLVFSSEDMNSSFSVSPMNKFSSSSAERKSIHPRSSARRMESGSKRESQRASYRGSHYPSLSQYSSREQQFGQVPPGHRRDSQDSEGSSIHQTPLTLTRNSQSMVSIINERQRRLSRIQKVRDINNNFLSQVVHHPAIREEENENSESEQFEKDLVLKNPSPLKTTNLYKKERKIYPKSHVYHSPQPLEDDTGFEDLSDISETSGGSEANAALAAKVQSRWFGRTKQKVKYTVTNPHTKKEMAIVGTTSRLSTMRPPPRATLHPSEDSFAFAKDGGQVNQSDFAMIDERRTLTQKLHPNFKTRSILTERNRPIYSPRQEEVKKSAPEKDSQINTDSRKKSSIKFASPVEEQYSQGREGSRIFAYQSSIQHNDDNPDQSLSILQNLLGTSFRERATIKQPPKAIDAEIDKIQEESVCLEVSNMKTPLGQKQQNSKQTSEDEVQAHISENDFSEDSTPLRKKSLSHHQEMHQEEEASDSINSVQQPSRSEDNEEEKIDKEEPRLEAQESSGSMSDTSESQIQVAPQLGRPASEQLHVQGHSRNFQSIPIPLTQNSLSLKNKFSHSPPRHSPTYSYKGSNATSVSKYYRPLQTFEELLAEAHQRDCRLTQLTALLSKREIPCEKYHYSVHNGGPKLSEKSFATLKVSANGEKFTIHNLKPVYKEWSQKEKEALAQQKKENIYSMSRRQQLQEFSPSNSSITFDANNPEHSVDSGADRSPEADDEDIKIYKKSESAASCSVNDIEGFVFGGFSSRFWMLRKHLISIAPDHLMDHPVYSWQCLTLQLPLRDVDLVIKDQDMMNKLLEFLMLKLKSVNGDKSSLLPKLKYMMDLQFKRREDKNSVPSDKDFFLLKRMNMEDLAANGLVKFKMLRARMKISFMAFQKNKTVFELFMDSILKSFNALRSSTELAANEAEALDLIISGQSCSISPAQSLQYKRIKLMGDIQKACNKERVDEIFKVIMQEAGHQIPEIENNEDYAKFKFQRTEILNHISRLKVLIRLGLVKGPVYIRFRLKIYELERRLFTLLLGRGIIAQVPDVLDMSRLPYSYRFYDPIINMVTAEFKGAKRDFNKLRNSIQLAFSVCLDEAPGRKGGSDRRRSSEFKDKKFDFRHSSSTRQVQKSKYLKIDDDISKEALRLARSLNQQQVTSVERERVVRQKVQEVHLRFVKQAELHEEQENQLKIKRLFSQQLVNLKRKGKMLEVMNKFENDLSKDLEMRLEERGAFIGTNPQATQGQQLALPEDQNNSKKRDSDTQFEAVDSSDQSSTMIEQHQLRRVLSTAKNYKRDKMLFQVGVLRESIEKQSQSKASLLDQLTSVFKKRFLDPSIGNKYKAVKKQKEELTIQAADIAFNSYKRNLFKTKDQLSEVLNDPRMKVESKHEFIDKQIERDIMYFNPRFHSNNQQIHLMKLTIKHIEQKIKERQRVMEAKARAEQEQSFENFSPNYYVGQPLKPIKEISPSDEISKQILIPSPSNTNRGRASFRVSSRSDQQQFSSLNFIELMPCEMESGSQVKDFSSQ